MQRCIRATMALAYIVMTSAYAQGEPAKAPAIANQVCAACHGFDGNSPLPSNPSIAGQHADYLLKQLTEFKSALRKNPIMTPIAASLSPDDMRDLANYYSSLPPKQMAAKDETLVEQGRKLYRGGNASNGVAACAGCHSPNGAGIPSQFPRLASQHADYVATQLKAFRAGDRANDPNQMMRTTAIKLTDKDISALAEYISGLH
ncbi:MAG TPA: c-type cytochrome [Burkholderiales bacterium]|jgi:cytochrome c553|nr:c-type cytochrome [Burkholderiales bacterium]